MDVTAVACALLAAAAYYNTLDAGFVYDDRRAILGNPDVTGNETSLRRLLTSDFWGTPLRLAGSHGSWRPLAVLSFRANHLLAGLGHWHWHGANVALHALCTALLVRLARRLAAAPAVTGAAFALHPAHCEAVAGLVGRADVAACACVLLALLCYAKHVDLRDGPRPVARRRCHGCGVTLPHHRPRGFPFQRALRAAKTLLTAALYSASDRLSCQNRASSRPSATSHVTTDNNGYTPTVWPRKRSASTPDSVDTQDNDANNNNSSSNSYGCQDSSFKTSDDFENPPGTTLTSSFYTTSYKQHHCPTLRRWLSTEEKENNNIVHDTGVTLDANHNTEFFTPSRTFPSRHQNIFDQPYPEERIVKRSVLKSKREATGRVATNMLKRRWKKCFKDKNLFTECGEDHKHLVHTAEMCACSAAEGCNKDESHTSRGGSVRHLVASVVLSACALLCKETGVAALALCLAYDVALLAERGVTGPRQLLTTRRGRRALPSLCVASASLVALVVARLWLVAACGGATVAWSSADNPASRAPSLVTRALTLAYLPAFSWLHLLLCPTKLCFDWGMAAVPLLHSLLDPRAAISAAFYAALVLAVRACMPHRIAQVAMERRRQAQQVSPGRGHRRPGICTASSHANTGRCHRCCCRLPGGATASNSACYGPRGRGALLVGLSLAVAPFLPASNLARYVGFAAAERVLYLPSAGHCLLVGLGWRRITRSLHHQHWGWLSGVALAATLAGLGARTVVRNRDWHDEESLFRSAIHINPPKAYGNLGCVLSSAGRLEEAEWALRQALKHRPNMADVHYNLGNLLVARGRPEEAERSYRLAIHYRPSLAAAYVSLGQLLEARGQLVEASQVYEDGAHLGGERLRDPAAHLQAAMQALLRLARLRAHLGDWRAAADPCRQALSRHRAAQAQGISTQAVEPLVEEARQRLHTFQQMLDASEKPSPLHSVEAAAGAAGAEPGRRRRAAGAA